MIILYTIAIHIILCRDLKDQLVLVDHLDVMENKDLLVNLVIKE